MRIPTHRLIAPLAVGVALAASSPAIAAPSPFRHDLGLIDGHLRIAIEYAPEELGESMRGAELVCGLGERASSGGEADLASADWKTLGQLVAEVATEDSRRVAVAFGNADSVLADLRQEYERRWAGAPTHLRALRDAVAETRRGIAIMHQVIAGLKTPFANWEAHECEAATRGLEATFTRAPDGLERINVGMLRLWKVALLPPPPNEGR